MSTRAETLTGTPAPPGTRVAESAWRVPLQAWAASRVLILALALITGLLIPSSDQGLDPSVPSALAPLGAWDTGWYLDIARYGYSVDYGQVGLVETNLAFFPGLPMLMAGALTLGLNPFAVSFAVANIAFLFALMGLHSLTSTLWDRRFADRAVWCLALFPPSLFASLAYTEGLTLALAIGAALAAVRRNPMLAGVLAAGATLMRPSGVLAAILVAVILAREPGNGRVKRVALGITPAAVAVVGFAVWMQMSRGSATLPYEAQAAWDRGPVLTGLVTHLPGELVAYATEFASLDFSHEWSTVIRDIGFLGFYVLLLGLLISRFGWKSPWVLYSLLVLALPLGSGSFTSMARLGLLAFPLMWPLAEWLERDHRRIRPAATVAVLFIAMGVLQLAVRAP